MDLRIVSFIFSRLTFRRHGGKQTFDAVQQRQTDRQTDRQRDREAGGWGWGAFYALSTMTFISGRNIFY